MFQLHLKILREVQSEVCEVLRASQFVVKYLNDILIAPLTEEEHKCHVRTVFVSPNVNK